MNVYPLKRFVILCFFSLIFKSLEYVLVIMFFFKSFSTHQLRTHTRRNGNISRFLFSVDKPNTIHIISFHMTKHLPIACDYLIFWFFFASLSLIIHRKRKEPAEMRKKIETSNENKSGPFLLS